jgi:hypothetical protein
MKHTLKESKPEFSLLYLEHTEYLFNSIKAYAHKITNSSKNM